MKAQKVLVFMLVVLLLLQSIPATAKTSEEILITDFYETGTMTHLLDKKYTPVSNLDVLKILYRMELLSEHDFTDGKVVEIQTDEPSVFWMYSYLTLPDSFLKEFQPDEPCTRENLSILFYHYADHLSINLDQTDTTYLTSFSDYTFVKDSSQKAFAWSLQNEIIPATYDIPKPQFNLLQPPKAIPSINPNAEVNMLQLENYLINYLSYISTAEMKIDDLAKVVEFTRKFLGCNYIWGGASPKGFDCSGLIYYVFTQSGYDLKCRDTAASYSRNYGTNIMKKCLDENGKIDWSKVPVGSVIGLDWDGDGYANHVGLWTGNSLLHARGGPDKQYAKNGYMVYEYFLGEGNGGKATKDYGFNEYYQRHVCAIRSFEKYKTNND